ncbi:MAG: response regulator transcription factor [Thermoguttaceae bacterium]|jgi:DNA-binding NarL/FixJ family response regulator
MNQQIPSPSTTKKYKVLIVEDHPITRRGLVELIAMEPDMEVCGEAAGMAEAIKQIEAVCPDVAIIDISLKDGNGLELIEHIKANHIDLNILVFSVHDELLFAERSIRAGALGYINKQESTENLLNAIRQVMHHEIYLSARMANRLMYSLASRPSDIDPIKTLSNREMEVFELLGQGLSTQQIANKLKLSIKTIKSHQEKIIGKMDMKNCRELYRCAMQRNLEIS